MLTFFFCCCCCGVAFSNAAAASQEEEGNAPRAKLQALLPRKQEAARWLYANLLLLLLLRFGICSCCKPRLRGQCGTREASGAVCPNNLSDEYMLTFFFCCCCCGLVATAAAASQEEGGNAARAKLQVQSASTTCHQPIC
jgi:hypothetical protein